MAMCLSELLQVYNKYIVVYMYYLVVNIFVATFVVYQHIALLY